MRELTMNFDTLIEAVQSASWKGFLRQRPVFNAYGTVSPDQLDVVERKIGVAMPIDLRRWLLTLGYGDIDEELSFREEWFSAMESGQLKGGALFAQDALGNFYGFDPCDRIYFFSRSQTVFSAVSESFPEFIEKLLRRDYDLTGWVDTLATQEYEWE